MGSLLWRSISRRYSDLTTDQNRTSDFLKIKPFLTLACSFLRLITYCDNVLTPFLTGQGVLFVLSLGQIFSVKVPLLESGSG